jgi:probable rRNA maturation factor
MNIRIENRQKVAKLDLRRIRRVIRRLNEILSFSDQEISLLFVDNAQIQELNRRYLKRDHPTNVISFSIREGDCSHVNPHLLVDIVISVERALQDAASGDLPFNDEIDFLLIHGLLHLLGYDHENAADGETNKMRDKEDALFFLLKGYRLERF